MSPGPFRSKKVRDHARGQACTLEFYSFCNHDSQTTIFAHIRDEHKGAGIKASDSSGCFACSACHAIMDEHPWRIEALPALQIRAMQRTWAILIADGIIGWPHDEPSKPKATKPRKPKADRQPIPSRKAPIPSRPFARKP